MQCRIRHFVLASLPSYLSQLKWRHNLTEIILETEQNLQEKRNAVFFSKLYVHV